MTALGGAGVPARISRPVRSGEFANLPVQAGANVRQGSAVEIDGAGRVAPAVKGANKTYAGVAQADANNTSGAAGAIKVEVRMNVAFHFSITGTAVVGKTAYIADDNTVTDASAGASKFGRIIDSDADGVWVHHDTGV